jgi:hypothetical protein
MHEQTWRSLQSMSTNMEIVAMHEQTWRSLQFKLRYEVLMQQRPCQQQI